MRRRQSVYHMTDRELRAYKRKKRRQQEIRRRLATLALTLCLIILGTVSYHGMKSSADTGERDLSFKYYTRITVQSGETLWDIADQFIDYSRYEDKQAYVAEVIHINRLGENAAIRSGQHIVVPYFSSEFVK